MASKDLHRLSELADTFHATRNVNAAALCLDYQFTDTPSLAHLNVQQTSQVLQRFWQYIQILQDLSFLIDPAVDDRVWKLFAIKQQDDSFVVFPGTLIHAYLSKGAVSAELETNTVPAQVLSKDELRASFQTCLKARLLDRVRRQNDISRPALGSIRTPCLRHITYADCDRSDCGRGHFVPDASWYQELLDVHFLQIFIYSSICRIERPQEVHSQQRYIFSIIYSQG